MDFVSQAYPQGLVQQGSHGEPLSQTKGIFLTDMFLGVVARVCNPKT